MAKSKSLATTTKLTRAEIREINEQNPQILIPTEAERQKFCAMVVEEIEADAELADALLKALCEDGKALCDADDWALVNIAHAINGEQRARLEDDMCHEQHDADEQRAWLEYYARRLGRPAEDLISQALAFEIEEHVWDHELEEKTGVLWCDDAERNALTAELDNRGN